jgi:NTE family protein
MEKPNRKTVAIGCQGGGMHAAFEVGVLTKILEASAKPESKFKLVGLSGTSAGALCALMAWYGLAPKRRRPGSAVEAISALNRFWDQFVAGPGAENVLNLLTVGALEIAETEIPMLGLGAGALNFNPLGAFYRAVAACLPSLGVRREYFDLEYVLNKACPDFADIIWNDVETRLLIGASEAINGYETVFDSDLNKPNAGEVPIERWRQRLPLSLAGVAASGTLPSVREAQRIEGCGSYWDGLYSQNPPVREFVEDRRKAPDEVWILRINPQRWPKLPETLGEIRDRENELMGNLSLHKDLDFIQKVNNLSRMIKLIKDGHEAIQKRLGEKDEYIINIGAALQAVEPLTEKEVVVRTIKMRKETCDELQYSSKFNRSRDVLHRLRDEGRDVGEEWLRGWPDHLDCYPDDAGYRTRQGPST